ncbi:MAG: hypothetical protein AB9873_20285 [Syntrophobacteraceae bacterium]
MRLEKTVDLGSTVIRVHEPTVGQIRNLLTLENLSFDPMGFMAGRSEIPTEILELVTDLSSEKLKQLTLSEFGQVLEGAREMLRPFFSIMDQLMEAAGLLRGFNQDDSTSSSATSSGSDTSAPGDPDAMFRIADYVPSDFPDLVEGQIVAVGAASGEAFLISAVSSALPTETTLQEEGAYPKIFWDCS